MIVSTRGRYALRVMIDLAEQNADTYVPLKDIVQRRLAGEDTGYLAYRFHKLLAEAAAEYVSANAGRVRTAALSGGCYQNTLLLELTRRRLEEAGMQVLLHRLVPPNDGGIALGQAVVAMQALEDQKTHGK